MPITNRAKAAVNTVIANQSVPTMNQQATMTARGQLQNQTPHEGRSIIREGTNVFLGISQTINTMTPVIGAATQVSNSVNEFNRAQGLGKVAAAAKIAGGTVTAISRGASAISGITNKLGSVLSGSNSSSQSPITAIKQVDANIPGLNKFTNPSSLVGGMGGGIGFGTGNPLTAIQQMAGGAILEDILLTHGKKTDNAEIKYRIIIQFEGKDKTKYDDVMKLSVYRIAIVQSCSKYVLIINLPPVLLAQLKQQQAMNKMIKLNMKIYQVDTENKNKLKNLIVEKNLVGKVMEEGGGGGSNNASIEKGNSVTCTFVLYNPTLYAMDTSYTFNKIQNAKSPYEILQDYESHITSTYGDNFESKHIIGKKNEHKYEQVVTQPTDQEIKLPNRKDFKFLCKHDSDIPLFLNYKYKVDNTLAFYFFDDFDLKSKKQITRFFISLYDKNKFEKFKVTNQEDIYKQTQLTGSFPFYDADGLLTPGNTAGALKLINGQFSPKKEQSGTSIKGNTQVSGEGSTSKGDPSRKFNVQKTTETEHQTPTKTTQSNNQVPDTPEANEQRSESANKTFTEKIAQMDSFVTKNCGFDFPRFGVIYAMNEKRPNEYLHTPLSIANLFKRENDKETVLGHSVKYLTVKFSPESSSESDSKSESSNKGSNENRDATKKAQDANPKKEKPQSTNPPTSKGSSGRKGDSPTPVAKGSSGGGTPKGGGSTPAPQSSGGAVPGPVTNNPAKAKEPEVNLMSVEDAEATMDDWD